MELLSNIAFYVFWISLVVVAFYLGVLFGLFRLLWKLQTDSKIEGKDWVLTYRKKGGE